MTKIHTKMAKKQMPSRKVMQSKPILMNYGNFSLIIF